MTNKDRKAEIRERMAKTGEPYTEARRHLIESRPRGESSAEREKIYVDYTLSLDGKLEFDAKAWSNALSNERQRMVEKAVGEQLDTDFSFYGGQHIAECFDGGALEFEATTEAEIQAANAAEAIEFASREYAGISEYDDWPDGIERPIIGDSYVTLH
jgi:hypothetical protein